MSQVTPPNNLQLSADDVVRWFSQLYYTLGEQHRQTWMQTKWMGRATEKCPMDLWIYQELLHLLRPDLIIETGTLHGGSALFLCPICDLLGQGGVVTIDINLPSEAPRHPRLTYLTGSS